MHQMWRVNEAIFAFDMTVARPQPLRRTWNAKTIGGKKVGWWAEVSLEWARWYNPWQHIIVTAHRGKRWILYPPVDQELAMRPALECGSLLPLWLKPACWRGLDDRYVEYVI